MSDKVTVKLEDLGRVMESEIGKLAKHNKEVVAGVAKEIPEQARTRSLATYGQVGLRVRSGQLRMTTEGFARRGGDPGTWLSGLRNEKNYAVIQHEGSKAHEIRPRGQRALFWKGAQHPVKKVRHPGTKARPWLSMAISQAAQGAMDRLKQLIGWG